MTRAVVTRPFHERTEALHNLCIAITDCHHSTPNWTESGKWVVRSENIKSGRISPVPASFTDDATFRQRISRSVPEPGDLVVTREAPMGEVGMVPEGIDCCLGQRLVLVKPDPKKVDRHFLLYAMQSEFIQKQIGAHNATGSTVSNLRIPLLKELRIPLPKNAKSIGMVLSKIDAKIDLNNRINAELETLAKTIYDYWFVQFDFPDANGRPYRSSGGKMVWNDTLKREIPAGWEAGALSSALHLVYGKPLKDCDRSGTGYPVMGSNGVVGYHDEYLVEGPGIVVGRKGTAGAITFSHENFFPIDTSFYVKPKANYGILFLHQLLLTLPLARLNSDSAVPGLNRESAHRLPVILPPVGITGVFDAIADGFARKGRLAVNENRELTHLRDWLLPLLMNGQVRVAERETESTP